MSDPLPVPPPANRALNQIDGLGDQPRREIRVTSEEFGKLLVGLATNVWKMRGRVLVDPKGDELREELKKEEVKKLARHLDSIYEALTVFGIEIRDRTGEAYDYGLPEKIVSSSPRSGLTKELIVETIKPTIYWQSQIAQTGEVVIATPLENKTENK